MRNAKVLSITLPSPMLQAAKKLARLENRTMSELVREALRHYQRQKRWDSIAAFGQVSAEKIGVRNEEDVVQAIHDFRREKRLPQSKSKGSKRTA
jgi:CopG family transcriptional regulator / antitoxin EndoAI